MVAEAETFPVSIIERDPIPLATRLKVKNLYLVRELKYELISKETGLTPKQIGNLIHREGWCDFKKERDRILEKAHDERASIAQTVIVEAIASQGEELALSGIDRAREAVKSRGKDAAKNFQSWTAAIKNIVGAVKTVRGSDIDANERGNVTANLFFLQMPAEQKPSEPKSVTQENEAKTVIPI